MSTTNTDPQPPKKRRTAGANGLRGKRPRSLMARAARAFVVGLDIVAGAGLVASGYGGCVSPLEHGGIYGVMLLSFPIWLAACVVLLLGQLLFFRKGAVLTAVFMLATSGPVLDFAPLHLPFPSRKPAEGNHTFTLLTYNVSNTNYWLQNPTARTDTTMANPILDMIISRKPDVVCLQELHGLWAGPATNTTPEQLDSINRIYPYIIRSGASLMLLSKFPAEAIHLEYTFKEHGGDMAAYALMIADRRVALFNVHLQSIGLSPSDKDLYRDLTKLQVPGAGDIKNDIRDVKSQLLDKLSAANVQRARQCRQLVRYLEHYGGPDAIVCGDFNDVPDCYTIRELGDYGMRDVYPEIGFGPMYTFNANRFFFCIDHILYRGSLRPLDITKGRMKWSDHYPLTVEFEVTGNRE